MHEKEEFVVIGLFALVLASLFTGAAFYITLVEQPARLALEDRSLLAEWKPSYKRGFNIQGSLAATTAVIGVIAYVQAGNWLSLVGALAIFANWPYTLIFLIPTNNKLLAIPLESAGPETRRMIEAWGRGHLVRGCLGAMAVVAFLLAALS